MGWQLDFVPPEEKEKTKAGIKRALAGEIIEVETKRLTKKSEIKEVLLKTAPFRQADGALVGIYVIHRDLAESKRAERDRFMTPTAR